MPRHEVVLPSSGGAPLPEELRREMQRAFGYDLSGVRVFEGPEAERMGAVALARGSDLFFRPGAYDPNSAAGRRLIGHELAHVLQQAQGRVSATRTIRGVAVNDDAGLEHEADQLAARAMDVPRARRAEEPPLAALPRTTGTVQRAMGMEFETTLPIVERLGYHAVIYEQSELNWTVTDDDHKVEFVTKPLKTRAEVITAVRQIQGFVEAAKKLLARSATVAISEIVKEAKLPPGGSAHVGAPGYKPEMLMAKPQVTVGIPLDRIVQLMADARELPLTEYDTQLDNHESRDGAQRGHTLLADESSSHAAAAPIDPLLAALRWGERIKSEYKKKRGDDPEGKSLDDGAIDRAVGVMAYILKYLNDAHHKPPGGAADYAKAYFPMMARTHFVAMYESLGRAKTLLTSESILECWGTKPEKCDVAMMRLGYKDGTETKSGPTINEWIESIVGSSEQKQALCIKYHKEDQRFIDHYAGNKDFGDHTANARSKDLLSRGDVAFNNVSMGLFGMDHRSETVPLAVVELRQFPDDTNLQSQYWDQLAGRLFDFYTNARRSSDTSTLVQQIQWNKDVLGSLIGSVRKQIGELRNTTDDRFNERMLEVEARLCRELAAIPPTDHAQISAKADDIRKVMKSLRREHAKRTTTRAHAVTEASTHARIDRACGGHATYSDGALGSLASYFRDALDSLAVKHDATTQHNVHVYALRDRVEAGPVRWDAENLEFHHTSCAAQLARLQVIAARYKSHADWHAELGEEALADASAKHQDGLEDDAATYLANKLGDALIGDGWSDPKRAPDTVKLTAAVDKIGSYVDHQLQNARLQKDPTKRAAIVDKLIAAFVERYAEARSFFLRLEPTHGAGTSPKPTAKPGKEYTGGDCLFDATIVSLGPPMDAALLRLRTSEEVRQNPTRYIDRLVNTGHNDVMVEINQAADFLAAPGNWDADIGDLAPLALAEVLAGDGRQLIILNTDGSVRYTGPSRGVPLFIYYNGHNHYTASEAEC